MIRGKWSVAELADLLIAKDQEMKSVEDAWRKFDPTWLQIDGAADNAWMSDFNALKTRYGAARARASGAVAAAESAHEDEKSIPADAEYRGVIAALKQDPGTVSTGDLQDVYNRIQSAITANAIATNTKPIAIQTSPVWQPQRGSDADLNVIRNLGGPGITGAIEGLGSNLLHPLTPLASDPDASPPKSGSHVARTLAIGGALTLGAIAAVKIGWKVLKPF